MKLPSYVQLEPVGQCNLRCRMCAIQFRRDGPPHGPLAFMDYDLFTRLVDENPELRDLHLQGLGEPMMHPRFFDMVSYAAARGVRVTTNTNGTLLNGRRAEACVTGGLAGAHISIDGATPETYEHIRVRSKLERVIRGLKNLQAAKVRLGSAAPRIKMVVVIMRRNLHELPALVRLAHEHGVDEVFVQHLCHDFGESSLPAHYRPMRDFVEDQTLFNEDLEQVERHFDAARAAAGELGVDLRLPRTRMKIHPPGTPGRQRCNWPWTNGYVSYDGHVMPCCMVSTPDRINFGQVDGRDFATIWTGEDFQRFRGRLDSDTPPEICRSCSIYSGTF